MSQKALDRIRTQLAAIPAADVRPSSSRARALTVAAHQIPPKLDESRRAKLAAIGYPLENLDEMTLVAEALVEAIALVNHGHVRPEGSRRAAVVERGEGVRDTLVRACRYHMRHRAGIELRLDVVAESTGALDLAFDLDVLAVLIEADAEAFAPDPSFDPAARANEARTLAREIRDVVAREGAEAGSEFIDLRDRASTLLQRHLRDLRAAVAYALPDDRHLLAAFRIDA